MTSTPRTADPRTPAASSVSGPPARRSPSSPTSASTPCSTAARSRPASRSATAARSSSTRTWAWSPRSSTRPPSRRCRATSRSATRRYSTTGASVWENAQPTFRSTADRLDRAGPQRQPDQHPRARQQLVADLPTPTASSTSAPASSRPRTNDTDLVTALLAAPPRPLARGAAPSSVLPQLQGAFSLRLDGRDHALRRPRPAGHPPARARPPRARLGGRLARPRRSTSSARRTSARSSPAS